MKPAFQITALFLLLSAYRASADAPAAPWIADQGNGTYRNPILYADYSDPDAIRVGNDYWMTSSSFNHVPGLPILHSKDLVNWTLVNHALPVIVPQDYYSTVHHGQAVYAPSIRYHAGKFWIFYPDPDYGIYVVTATDPAGKWSAPLLMHAGKGFIDPCPLWDDDGKAYLIYGWAGSRVGHANRLTLNEMSPDGARLLGNGVDVIDGRKIGWKTVEGPKLYKRDGYYWVFAPAGGVGGGFQGVYRAKNVWGPYENRNVLDQGTTKVNGPHQGAWVDTPKGEDWFLHFQKAGTYGRILHLEPMRWRDDGWPVIGNDPNNTGKGEPVLSYKKPDLQAQPIAEPATSDEFNAPSLGLQWQWEANPRADWWSLTADPGSVRLNCVPSPEQDSLRVAPNLLLQKFCAPTFTATAVLHFSPQGEGDESGLIVFGRSYAWVGLRKTGGQVQLQYATHRDKPDEKENVEATAQPKGSVVYLRVSVGDDAVCQFAWSEDGAHFTAIGKPFRASSLGWVGAKFGIFAATAPGAASSGYADYDWFRVTPYAPDAPVRN